MKSHGYHKGGRQVYKLDLFESWQELRVARLFQIHRLTNEALTILEKGGYPPPLNTDSVKAVQVRIVTYRTEEDRWENRRPIFGEPSVISIKVPETREIAGRRGLLVYDEPTGEIVPKRLARLPWGRDPVVIEPARDGLRMTRSHRVLCLTAERARLFPTGQILSTLGCGEHDRRNPDAGVTIPDDTAEALGTLIP